MPETLTLSPDAVGIAHAAALLASGRLVALPTETVYGLGADACNPAAVAEVFEAKGRPRFNPLIVHLADATEAGRHADIPPLAERLMAAHWPGPLTLVLPRRADGPVADLTVAGGARIALRVPAHPVARAVIRAAGCPVAAPSANPSGRVSPTTAAHVLDGLAGRIDAVLDAGPCPVGVESTILMLEGDRAVLLRPGGLAAETLAGTLGAMPEAPPDDAGRPQSPGRLVSHYAPGAALRLDADAPRPGEAWLGLGPVPGTDAPALSLSETGDLREAAANLFAHLRALDAALGGRGTIAVGPVPETGLGAAIADRLRRAAAPRGS